MLDASVAANYHSPMPVSALLDNPGTLSLAALVVVLVLLYIITMLLLLRRLRGAGTDGGSGSAAGMGDAGAPGSAGAGTGNLAATLTKIGEELGRLEQLAGDVEHLRSVFLTPRRRGIVGELMLEQLLSDWLPQSAYSLQHSFRDGARVDAVVRLGEYLVAIDAKFPLESLGDAHSSADPHKLQAAATKALRPQIESISQKYIRTEEGTLPFALMYLPSEHLYYEAFVTEEGPLWRFALEHGVVPVGPNALLLYLQTVAYGLRGFAFSEHSRSMSSALSRLSQDVGALGRELQLAEKHFQNFENSFRNVGEGYRHVAGDTTRLDGGLKGRLMEGGGSTAEFEDGAE